MTVAGKPSLRALDLHALTSRVDTGPLQPVSDLINAAAVPGQPGVGPHSMQARDLGGSRVDFGSDAGVDGLAKARAVVGRAGVDAPSDGYGLDDARGSAGQR